MYRGLPPELMQFFFPAACTISQDGGGSIDSKELKDLMASVGQNPTDDELAEMIRIADADGTGARSTAIALGVHPASPAAIQLGLPPIVRESFCLAHMRTLQVTSILPSLLH